MMESNHWEAVQDIKLPKSTTIDLNDFTPLSISVIRRALCSYGIALVTFGRVSAENDVILSLISALGQTHTHDGKGREIWDVRVGGSDGLEALAISHSDREFFFHTDCCYEADVPGYFALYVVQQDRLGGGVNLLIKSDVLLSRLSPETFQTLTMATFPIRVPEEFYKGRDRIHSLLVDEDHNFRYRRDLIVREELDARQSAALTELETQMADPRVSRRIRLSEHQMMILDNKRYLHARTPIKDRARHLKRVRFNMECAA
ncbi:MULTISPECIES: TauD/TfdA family dioxygenase [Thiomonas]|uniref:TauD/TfdA family dioxygenase n=2 Tax=Thiomonas TaxID=32012 RepID=A0A8I1SXJ6_THIA3|nr:MULTISPECIES: TauD/TfdA family dioxygenase [Thiomonas]ODU96119.1 MAG: hypothetical protein ABT24_10085 [Thiomonas sp. SCN 64-16]CQR44744.1 conserved hypothetical protein [Thiomonas sp. CB3]MBN8744591.1 TauD/TfdA family dioxygenase [Thiomonas arsenitoxydans]CDW92515.1 putative Taurine catabolism dioxygenase TauD, TfdA family [Thiomonas sp. CB2]VDY05788.1 conserved protein of unknown function [Thiomonas sp. Bio17B3]